LVVCAFYEFSGVAYVILNTNGTEEGFIMLAENLSFFIVHFTFYNWNSFSILVNRLRYSILVFFILWSFFLIALKTVYVKKVLW